MNRLWTYKITLTLQDHPPVEIIIGIKRNKIVAFINMKGGVVAAVSEPVPQ